MIIAMDKGYKELETELKKLGYHIVGLKFRGRVDAVLYNSRYEEGFLDSINHSNMVNGTTNSGVLLIDIKNKDAKGIDEILRRRLYTPLF